MHWKRINNFKIKSLRQYLAILVFIHFSFCSTAQNEVKLLSWNLQNFGKNKKMEQLDFIAEQMQPFDLIAIQEVLKNHGEEAIIRLTKILNKKSKGTYWKAAVSEPTSGNPYQSERYAFIWNSTRVQLIDSIWLDPYFEEFIEREPCFATFVFQKDTFTLVNFHAVPKSKQPEQEIKHFKNYPRLYPSFRLIFLGDFNVPAHNNVFNPLKKQRFTSALVGQKTTLKMKCVGKECLASEYDNFYYHPQYFQKIKAGIIPFYLSFQDMVAARKISDHVPIWFHFRIKSATSK